MGNLNKGNQVNNSRIWEQQQCETMRKTKHK